MTKLTISLPEDLAETIRAEAEADGTTVSGYVTEALRRTVLLAESRAVIREHEAEHGPITEADLERVRTWAGRSTPAR